MPKRFQPKHDSPDLWQTASLLLDVEEVAAMLDISMRSVWRRVSEGLMPKPIRLGTSVRWRRSEIEDWVAAGCPPINNDGLKFAPNPNSSTRSRKGR